MSNEYKYRSRNHLLVLYPEDTQNNHWLALQYICDHFDYAYCFHDKDLKEDGTPAKNHVHIVLRFKEATWNTSIAKQLDIEPRLFEVCKDLNKSLRYLVHADHPKKVQYDYENIVGTMADQAKKLLDVDRSTESMRALEIFSIIESHTSTVRYTDIFKECCSRGLYGDLRRMGGLLSKLVEEHNIKYFDFSNF